MKIGLSLSRCVTDIIEGVVLVKDVMLIITRTDFDPLKDEDWNQIWSGYTQGGWSAAEWYNHKDKETEFRELITDLYKGGKIHQPRQFGAWPSASKYKWLDLMVTPEDLQSNPSVAAAWEQFQVISTLANIKIINH